MTSPSTVVPGLYVPALGDHTSTTIHGSGLSAKVSSSAESGFISPSKSSGSLGVVASDHKKADVYLISTGFAVSGLVTSLDSSLRIESCAANTYLGFFSQGSMTSLCQPVCANRLVSGISAAQARLARSHCISSAEVFGTASTLSPA